MTIKDKKNTYKYKKINKCKEKGSFRIFVVVKVVHVHILDHPYPSLQ